MSAPHVVVVTGERPDPSSPLGRARRIGHLLSQLAAAAPDVEFVTISTEGAVPWALADDADPTGWRDHLVDAARDAAAVVAADLMTVGATLDTLEAAALDLPVVATVDRLLCASMAEAAAHSEEPEPAGRALLADRVRMREQRALERAGAVVCFSEADATRIGSIAPSTDPLVFVAPAPVARERGFLARDGVFAFGAMACEPGHPDSQGLATLRHDVAPALARAGVTPAVEVVAEDANLRFRALGPHLRWRPPTDWSLVLGERAVGLSIRPFGGTTPQALMDVALRGLPFVATPASVSGLGLDSGLLVAAESDEIADRVQELVREQKRWAEVREVLLDWGRDLRARQPTVELVASVLDTLGLPARNENAGPARPVAVDGTASPPPGTLAAADTTAGPFERELLGRPVLSRVESHQVLISRPPDGRYGMWRAAADDPHRIAIQRERGASFEYRPKISVLLPVYDTRPDLLAAAVESLQAQTYDHWELCAVDDGSPSPDQYDDLRARAADDARIRVQRLDENRGIAGASNAALAMASGEFVALVDHDDLLYPDALYWVVRRLQDRPDLDLVYTDWDKVDDHGATHLAFLKPDWSPDLFLGVNYLIHLTVVRRSLMEDVGGWRAGFEGAQDFELFLRLTEQTHRIAHVSKPLYRWRMTAGSTAVAVEEKSHAHDAGRRALEDALARRGVEARVEPGHVPTHFRIRYARRGDPLVSIVIPTRDRVDLLRKCVTELTATTSYSNYEIVVIDNQSEDPETLEYLAALVEGGAGVPSQVVPYPHPFNYARLMNLGVAAAAGDLILMLNNDVSGFSPEWLDALIEHGQRPEVGVVGARLRFPDRRAQHEGITLADLGGPAANLDGGGYFTYGNHVRDCLAVTGACLMTRPGVFWGVGGFDEGLRVAWNDVDFCLRVSERGWRVVYTPYAELVHPESASRGPLDPAEDRRRFEERWGPPGTLRDPFFHPGLDLLNPLMFRL